MKLKDYVLLTVVGLSILIFTLDRCSSKKANDLNTSTELIDLRRFLADSISSANNNAIIAHNDSMQEKQAIITQQLTTASARLRKGDKERKALSDSLEKLVNRKDTVCIKALSAKNVEIDSLRAECDTITAEAISYSKELFLCEKTSVLKDGSIKLVKSDLQVANNTIEQLKKSNKRNWFERNKLWLGFVAGAGGVLFLSK